MIKFTKEEISLCKQVAEKHRREIEYGDWSLNEGGFVKVWPYRHNCKRIELIPLWTISDCLEWLNERYDDINIAKLRDKEWELEIQDAFNKVHHINHVIKLGKTPLEACLKAVLAVLEEEK